MNFFIALSSLAVSLVRPNLGKSMPVESSVEK
jgi:hypothetical protein